MDENHRKIIDKNMVALVNDMNAFRTAINLQSKHLFTDYDVDTIVAERTDMERRRRLLVVLKTKGNAAFSLFVKALQETEQKHLYNLIVSDNRMAASGSIPSADLYHRVQKSLKKMYLQRFKKVNPFSLPFTFDIENTWVSLALRGDHLHATEDHAKLLNNAFEREKMLIIEGKPASGKTSLMRRLAYEWGKGERKLSHYDLIVYAEFRKLRDQEFDSIADLVLEYNKSFLESEELEYIKSLLCIKKSSEQRLILLLIDGYDESTLDKQCKELHEYFTSTTISKQFMFNIVLTTRPGYLGQYRGNRGRFIFADVLGFITIQQKETYINNHFKSAEIDRKENIEAVHRLLQRNENMNQLAEIPLLLTFICLVHERIVDGTVLELYCNIIWWLIDRHQKDFPDRDIPLLFEFHSKSDKNKFKIIQDHYHQFPQLHCLGKMGLQNLNENIFRESDCQQFNLKEIIQQVGLLRKDEYHDERFRLTTSYSYPHRTIQEFLAALYFFCSKEELDLSILDDEEAAPNSELDTSNITQYQSFLLQVVLSNELPILPEKSKIYFESLTDISVDLTFHAFNTVNELNINLLNAFFSQCKNVQSIYVNENRGNLIDSLPLTKISGSTLAFNNLLHMHIISFHEISFQANSQLSFKSCPALKNMKLWKCEIKSGCIMNIEASIAIDTLEFDHCTIDLDAWESITEEISKSSVRCIKFSPDCSKYLECVQKCDKIEEIRVVNIVMFQFEFKDYENDLVPQLISLAQNMESLKSIIFDFSKSSGELKEINKELIEKAGQERDPNFTVSIVT